MAYLGNDLKIAYPTYVNIDDISGSFNGSTTSFALLVRGAAPTPLPLNSQQCLISVAGVLQRPDDTGAEGFRLSGGNIVFSSAPASGADFFGVILAGADYVNAGGTYPDGSAAVPSITFTDDTDTGLFRSSSGVIGITCNSTSAGTLSSTGLQSVLGSAANPSLSFVGDTNTGIFSPGADTIAFTEGGVEAMRIDSSARLLVGTSTAQGLANIQIQGDADSAKLYLRRNITNSAMTSSGQVVLGSIDFGNIDGAVGARIQANNDTDSGWANNDYPSRLVFSTTADGASSPTERMRIGQSGFTKISNSATYNDTAGTYHELVTTLTGSNNVLFRAPASYGSDNIKSFVLTAAGTGFNHFLADSNGTTVCVIRGNGNLGNTNNVYTSLSDSKLKENIVDAGSQWSDIKSLQVRKYNFKEDTKYETHTQIGLVAQEVELVSPGLIEEYPDRDAGGNDLGTTTKSVKYSVLYMKAVKALQEAMERIEALEAKVAALEAS